MHTDPDVLALHALGEDELTATDRQHLATCRQCTADAASLRDVVSLARGPVEAHAHELPVGYAGGPSPHVWSGIAAELGLSPEVAVPPGSSQAFRPAPPGRSERTTRPSPRPSRRRRGTRLTLAAALTVVIAAVATTVVALRPPQDEQAQLAARLEPLTAPAGTGQAEITGAGTTAANLRLTVEGLPDTSGYHEIWLIDLETGQLVSLGVVSGDGLASYTVPPGLDLARYDVVDISDEPLNGDPSHSGVSLLRGTLA